MSPANGEPNDLCQVGDVIHTSWGFDQSKATQWKIWGRLMATGHRKRVSASDRCRVRYIPRMSQPDFQPILVGPPSPSDPSRQTTAGIVRSPAPTPRSGKSIRCPIATPKRAFANSSIAPSIRKGLCVRRPRDWPADRLKPFTTATSPNAARSRSAGRSSPQPLGRRDQPRVKRLMLDTPSPLPTPRSSGSASTIGARRAR